MGTATKALKQELIDTAVELGVIKEGEVTIASFESSLQKKWANRVMFINEGTIAEEGTPEEVFGAPKSERLQEFLSRVL